ncbi:2505_t:CDS:1, partial [Racocetra fulgida]
MVPTTLPISLSSIRQPKDFSPYVIQYKEELKRNSPHNIRDHNLREKVIILNAAKAYRDKLESKSKT